MFEAEARLFVPAGGGAFLSSWQRATRLPGRWLPVTVRVNASALDAHPLIADAVEAEEVVAAETRRWGWLSPSSPPAAAPELSIDLERVTLIYDTTAEGECPLSHASHPAIRAGPRSAHYVMLRVLPDHTRHNKEVFAEDAPLLFRMATAALQTKLHGALADCCPALHNGWTPSDALISGSCESLSGLAGVGDWFRTPLRRLVSKKKRRFEEGGYSLDLVYVTPTIIAAGIPALPRDPDYSARNDINHVQRFMSERHRGRYRVINLCSERSYPPSAFGGSFARFPFDDHQAPPLSLLVAFVEDALTYLDADAANTLLIHCKAGKGRTGVAIVALMFAQRLRRDPESPETIDVELREYARQRTHNGKGVTIASQLRFLSYFERCQRELGGGLPFLRPVTFSSCTMTTTPWINLDGGCTPFIVIKVRRPKHHHRFLGRSEWRKRPTLGDAEEDETDDGHLLTVFDSRRYERDALQRARLRSYVAEPSVSLPLGSVTVADEVYFAIYDQTEKQPEFVCGCWLHTAFLDGKLGLVNVPKSEVDGANKGTAQSYFDDQFSLCFHYTPLPPRPRTDDAAFHALDVPSPVRGAATDFGAGSSALLPPASPTPSAISGHTGLWPSPPASPAGSVDV